MQSYDRIQALQNSLDVGKLQINVLAQGESSPVEDARIRISFTGDPEGPMEEVRTDASGNTQILDVRTPPLEYSMSPVEEQPYAEYTIRIEAEGFLPGPGLDDTVGQ